MNQNPHWKQLIWTWASIIFGNALYSLAVALFLEPAGLITGGATGIALAIGRLTGLPSQGCCSSSTSPCWSGAGWSWAGPLPSIRWPAVFSAPPSSPLFEGMAEWPGADGGTSSSAPSLRASASASRLASSSAPVHPPAASTSRRWCSTNGSSCRCRPPCWLSTSWSC